MNILRASYKSAIAYLGALVSVFSAQKTEVKLEDALKMGEVKLVAYKKCGELSEKVATKNQNWMDYLNLNPKGTGRSSDNVITFIDLTDKCWKSFVRSNIQFDKCELIGRPNVKIVA